MFVDARDEGYKLKHIDLIKLFFILQVQWKLFELKKFSCMHAGSS